MKVNSFVLVSFISLLACGAQEILNVRKSFSFGPGKGVSYNVPLRPEWGVLTLRTRMKTTGLVRGKEGWMDGRIPMSFHRADGKMVGG